MRQGQVVDGRFEIERPAGTGGMATVYRARDRTTGRPVALKLLGAGDPSAVARFEHEGRILARISHARVVQYVAHGVLDGGEPYLAMEWLEGESLAERLARGPLLVGESLAVARATAEALAAAHAQGVIHRDIKPSNLFLVGGEVEGLRVLDFGIARMARTVDGRLTQSGSVMGTPGYMAPEQASGEQDRIGARSDVFSLGAVLFECLTGRPAFEGKHVMAVLAKLLREEAPRVRDMRPELPPEIDALVAWMMAKDPEQRPRDGAEVAAALDALADPLQRATAADPTLAEAITDRELRLVSIVAASAPWAEDPGLEESTLDGATSRRLLDPIVAAAAPYGARLDEISGGTLLLSLAGTGDALDLAARAARCALRVRDLLAGSPVVIATGRAERGGGLPVGPVVDRAAALLASAPPRDARVPPRAVACPTVGAPGRAPRGGAPSAPNPIAMDDVTRALLDVRFEIEATERGAFLIGERDIGRHVRTLLGRPSPCVGRDRELRNLRELVEESLDEPAARVVLITGPAGIGKSRLRHELLEDLQRARPEAAIMIGRGDSMSAGSPLSLLGSAFRSAAGITGGEPKPAQRDKLLSLVERWCAADGPRIAGFLGELVGTPFPDETHPKLAAARGAPALMAEQILRAFLDFMAAWCAAGPRVLVLEDVHWADAASIKLVDRALGELRGAPLVTLGVARLEVREAFPHLWEGRDVQEVKLGALPRRAAEDLARRALGGSIPEAQIARIVERAGGNAFYLEELVRAVAEGRGDSLPDTILGMVEARLESLPADARRLLRAASVFGEAFWKQGSLALIGDPEAASGAGDLFPWLLERELIVERGRSRFAGQEEYSFRHALLREGCYATLTERDRALAHNLAAEWLLQAGEHDEGVLAGHFERGGEPSIAVELYARAAEHALASTDPAAALELAERGMDLGAEGETAAALRRIHERALEAEMPRSVRVR